MATATAMADGNAKETVAVMGDDDCNSNGQRQRRQQRGQTTATLTATAAETAKARVMAMAIALAMSTATAILTKGELPFHVPAMCSIVAGATPCLHPHGHKGKCIHQRCIMGVTMLRVFAPFQGRGFLTAHHGLFFVFFFQLLFSLLNNPLFAPCIIQALKNPVSPLMLYLLHSSKNPVSLLTIYPSFYCTFCQGKPKQGLQ
jgi:hypothetical protein